MLVEKIRKIETRYNKLMFMLKNKYVWEGEFYRKYAYLYKRKYEELVRQVGQ